MATEDTAVTEAGAAPAEKPAGKAEKAPAELLIGSGQRINRNPTDISFWALVAEDYRTNGSKLASCGFWALFVHRFGNWRFNVKNRLLAFPLNALFRLMFDFVRFFFGIQLSVETQVGRRVILLHHGGMYLGAAKIGDGVLLKQNTTMGYRIGGDYGLPTLEDNVEVGTGAAILGAVTIGHDSFVAANSLVLKDVPPNSIAMGVPARAFPKLDE